MSYKMLQFGNRYCRLSIIFSFILAQFAFVMPSVSSPTLAVANGVNSETDDLSFLSRPKELWTRTNLHDYFTRFGRSGYYDSSVLTFVFRAQQAKIDIGEYDGFVVGCMPVDEKKCEAQYKKFKAIQVLEDAVLWSFNELVTGGEIANIQVLTTKTDGRVYLEGQNFVNQFYAYGGLYSYETVLGAQRTVPIFVPMQFPSSKSNSRGTE